jgi:hypothetical protein
MDYFTNLKLNTDSYISTREGALDRATNTKLKLSYLSWAAALSLANMPEHKTVMFTDVLTVKPYLKIFGDAVVAVDMLGQRVWLPVLDSYNNPIATEKVTVRDINDSLMRCRAKAVAMTTGVGMSLYIGYLGDGEKTAKILAVTPESNLSAVPPILSKKNGKTAYLDWAAALAAVKIVDPEFKWEVQFFPSGVNEVTGEVINVPYLKHGDQFFVAVQVVYKGVAHCEYLPIMGFMPVQTKNGIKNLDHQPLVDPNAFDWNKSVMRCLAKAIAVVSGYGLSIYAQEDDVISRDDEPETKPDLTYVRDLIQKTGSNEASLCGWLGFTSLEEANQAAINKAEAALIKKLESSKAKAEAEAAVA